MSPIHCPRSSTDRISPSEGGDAGSIPAGDIIMNISLAIAVVGPTSSGKSALAIRLARQFDGEVISADSRQVYKGLDIGSGKLEVGKRGGIKHHLLDVANPRRTFTVAQYQKLANRALENITRRGKAPIICGGAGFYIDALLGRVSIPPVPPNAKLRRQLEKLGDRQLFRKLEKLDPTRAKNIDRYNRRRLIRAIEIAMTLPKGSTFLSQGRTLTREIVTSEVSPSPKDSPFNFNWLTLGIGLSPNELRKKINTRLKFRINHGLINEVKKLHGNGLSWTRLEALGLEYRYVARHLRGLISKKEMNRELETAIWHYAKRQMAWWKRDQTIQWVRNYKEARKLARQFMAGPPRLGRGTKLLGSAVLPVKP